jgi:glycerol kinase
MAKDTYGTGCFMLIPAHFQTSHQLTAARLNRPDTQFA